MDLTMFWSVPCVAICVFIMIQNTSGFYPRPFIAFNFLLDQSLRATLALMAAGGLFLYAECHSKTSFFRSYEDNFPTDFVDTICSKNSINSSMPAAWFEEVNDETLLANFKRFENYCLMVFLYVIYFAIIRKMWSIKEGGLFKELIPLVTSVLFPVDTEERLAAVVEVMTDRIRSRSSDYCLYLMFTEFMCFGLGIYGIYNPLKSLYSNQDLSVHLNGSEWIVDCDSQSRDLFVLTKCQYNNSNFEFGNVCIVSADNIYIHLHAAMTTLFLIVAIVSCVSLMSGTFSIWLDGRRRVGEDMLLLLLEENLDDSRYSHVLLALERKLEDRRRAMTPDTQLSHRTVPMSPFTILALGLIPWPHPSMKKWFVNKLQRNSKNEE